MKNRAAVIHRFIRARRVPSIRNKTGTGLGLPGLLMVTVLLVAVLHGLDAEALPLAFQSSPIGSTPTPSPSPTPTPTFDPSQFPTVTPTFDPGGLPTATPTFDTGLFPTATPTIDPNLFLTPTPAAGTTAALPIPPGSLTESLSTVLELPPPESLPLLPKPDPGAVPAPAPTAGDLAGEARMFGQTVIAAVTYVWMGCGLMLLLLAGAAFLWLHRRSQLR